MNLTFNCRRAGTQILLMATLIQDLGRVKEEDQGKDKSASLDAKLISCFDLLYVLIFTKCVFVISNNNLCCHNSKS